MWYKKFTELSFYHFLHGCPSNKYHGLSFNYSLILWLKNTYFVVLGKSQSIKKGLNLIWLNYIFKKVYPISCEFSGYQEIYISVCVCT